MKFVLHLIFKSIEYMLCFLMYVPSANKRTTWEIMATLPSKPGAIVIVIILTLVTVTIEVHGGELHNVRNTLCGFLLNTYLHMSVCSLGAIENTETLMVEVFIRAFITFIMLLYAWNPKGQMCWRWVPLVLVINFALTHRAREAMVGRASLTLLLHTVAVICVMV